MSFGNSSQIYERILKVDSEGDGNGVVTMEEWVLWKMTKESGELGTPAGKGRRGKKGKKGGSKKKEQKKNNKAGSLGNNYESSTMKAYGDYSPH